MLLPVLNEVRAGGEKVLRPLADAVGQAVLGVGPRRMFGTIGFKPVQHLDTAVAEYSRVPHRFSARGITTVAGVSESPDPVKPVTVWTNTRYYHSTAATLKHNLGSLSPDVPGVTRPVREGDTHDYFEIKNSRFETGQKFPATKPVSVREEMAYKVLGIIGDGKYASHLAQRLEVIPMDMVQATEEVTPEGVEEMVDGFKEYGVLSAPVVIFDSQGNLVVGDGNHRRAAMESFMGKGVFQVSGKSSVIEMRPYVITEDSLTDAVDNGDMVLLSEDESRGRIFVTDRKTGLTYVPAPEKVSGMSEVEKMYFVRNLFPDAISRLNQDSLKSVESDEFVITFDYDTIPGPDLPAKSFTVKSDFPRIFISGGLDSITPDELGVSAIGTLMNAYDVRQNELEELGFTVGGRKFNEGVVVLAKTIGDAAKTLASVMKALPQDSDTNSSAEGSSNTSRKSQRVGGTKVLSSAGHSSLMTERSTESKVLAASGRPRSGSPLTEAKRTIMTLVAMRNLAQRNSSNSAKPKLGTIAVFNNVDLESLTPLLVKGYELKIMGAETKVPSDTVGVLVRSAALDDSTFENVPHPENVAIVRLGSGVGNLKGVSKGVISRTPETNGPSVADLAYIHLGILFRGMNDSRAMLEGIVQADALTPGSDGDKSLKKSYEAVKTSKNRHEFAGKRVFVLGTGGVGSNAIDRGQNLNMDVTAVLREHATASDIDAKKDELKSKVDLSKLNFTSLDRLKHDMKPGDSLIICAEVKVNASELPDDINIVNMARQDSLELPKKGVKPLQRYASDEPTVELIEDLERGVSLTGHIGASTEESLERTTEMGVQTIAALLDGHETRHTEFRGTTPEDFSVAMKSRAYSQPLATSFRPLLPVPTRFTVEDLAAQLLASIGGEPISVPAGPVIATAGGRKALVDGVDLAFVSHRGSEVMALHRDVVEIGKAFFELDSDQVYIPSGVSASLQYTASVASLAESRDEPVQVVITDQWSQKAFKSIKREFPNAVAVPYDSMHLLNPDHPVHFTMGETISGVLYEPPVGCPKLVVDASTGIGAGALPKDAAYIYFGSQKAFGLAGEAGIIVKPNMVNHSAEFVAEALTVQSQMELGRTFSALNLAMTKGTLTELSSQHGDYSAWTAARRVIAQPILNAVLNSLHFELPHPVSGDGRGRSASPINIVFRYNTSSASLSFPQVIQPALSKVLLDSKAHKSSPPGHTRITTMHMSPEAGEKVGVVITGLDDYVSEHTEAVRTGKIGPVDEGDMTVEELD